MELLSELCCGGCPRTDGNRCRTPGSLGAASRTGKHELVEAGTIRRGCIRPSKRWCLPRSGSRTADPTKRVGGTNSMERDTNHVVATSYADGGQFGRASVSVALRIYAGPGRNPLQRNNTVRVRVSMTQTSRSRCPRSAADRNSPGRNPAVGVHSWCVLVGACGRERRAIICNGVDASNDVPQTDESWIAGERAVAGRGRRVPCAT